MYFQEDNVTIDSKHDEGKCVAKKEFEDTSDEEKGSTDEEVCAAKWKYSLVCVVRAVERFDILLTYLQYQNHRLRASPSDSMTMELARRRNQSVH